MCVNRYIHGIFSINNFGGRAWWHKLVIPVLWEAETGGSRFAASLSSLSLSLSLSLFLSLSLSLSLPSEALRNFVRPGFKIKYKKIGLGV